MSDQMWKLHIQVFAQTVTFIQTMTSGNLLNDWLTTNVILHFSKEDN